ncbi:uncharacterized protein MONBRDRAFT_34532, partial [Monosiga brevicollis MX1]
MAIPPLLVCLGDGALVILFFFITGLHHEHSYLENEQAADYAWDTSLLDVVVLAGVRLAILSAIWLYAEHKVSQAIEKDAAIYRPSIFLQIIAVGLPLASAAHAAAKLVLLADEHKHASGATQGLAIATAAVAVAGAFASGLLGTTLSSEMRRRQARHLLDAHETASGNDPEKGEANKKPPKVDLKRLISLAKPEKWLLAGGTFAMVFSSGATIAAPYLFGQVIDAATAKADAQHKLDRQILYLGIVYGVGSFAAFVRAWLFTWAGQRLVARVRRRVFAAIVRQDISFFDTNRTGELTNRLASDTQVIQNSVTVNISMLLRYVVQIVGSLIVMFFLSWRLTLVLLSVVPPVVIGAVFYGKQVRNLRKKFQDELAKASANAEETFSNIRT